jgi:hypothetical protein
MNVKEIVCYSVEWIHLAQYKVQWLALVYMKINFEFHKGGHNLLTSLSIIRV